MPHVGSGGDWTVVKTIMTLFQQNGHIVYLASKGANKTSFRSIELPINGGIIHFLSSLVRLLNSSYRFDIIHTHSPKCLLLGLLYRYISLQSIKLVFTFHLKTNDSFIVKIFKIFLIKSASIVHVCSHDVASFIEEFYKVKPNKIKTCYIGIDHNLFHPQPNRKNIYRTKYQIPLNAFVLLFSGRLSPEKNIGIILDYLALEKDPSIVLVVAGFGPTYGELKQKSFNLGLTDNVFFLGHISNNISELYVMSDLLVLPSINETFGMVVIEAAFCSLPVIRSATPGATDQIINGYNGFILSPYETFSISNLIKTLRMNQDYLSQVSRNAHIFAKNRFSLLSTYEDLIKLYTEVLKN
jgi:L-malate glycosyltransferase